MARKRGSEICTSECANCIHSDIDKDNIKIKFHCDAKDKDYTYGQYVSCELMERRKDGSTM